jgi:hypothetical protein
VKARAQGKANERQPAGGFGYSIESMASPWSFKGRGAGSADGTTASTSVPSVGMLWAGTKG